VIEVNARLSRSSALASKATGYPLAFIAAKLALGYNLIELENSITKVTKACFEPALDYVVVKIPRWDLKKFKRVSKYIDSSMKSVGEVMAIGRSFEETLQKAIRMLQVGMYGLAANKTSFENLRQEIKNPTDEWIFAIAEALEKGISIEEIYALSGIDKWFLYKIQNIVNLETQLRKTKKLTPEALKTAKQKGFSDKQLEILTGQTEEKIKTMRDKWHLHPVIKQIDTLGAEYPAKTNYLYLTYNGSENDIKINDQKNNVIVLGSGSYSIGSSVEFDWCCVNAVQTLNQLGYNTVMINYNPETVSTDYDVCDRLYFDELSFETVSEIYRQENPRGLIVSTGGQIPNNLALKCRRSGLNILGTSPDSIDQAENRKKFSKILDSLGVKQPPWKALTNLAEAKKFAQTVEYPVLIRPSYVLSGAAMSVAFNQKELEHFIKKATAISQEYPVVISKFILDAKEIEIDAVASQGKIVTSAISEHVENAGVHSGDATLVLPPQRTYLETIKKIRKTAAQIADQLKITGPFNIQFLAKNNEISVIECNLRASRSFPFVSKVSQINFIELAVKAMLGLKIQNGKTTLDLSHVGVKAPQFSFTRLKGADPVLGVEMASTGEVGCLGDDFEEAFLKSLLAVGYNLPKKNILLSTGPIKSKVDFLPQARLLLKMEFRLFATPGTAKFLKKHDLVATELNWPLAKKRPNILDYLEQKKIDLVVNIPKNFQEEELTNGYLIRRQAADYDIPLITNIQLAQRLVEAIAKKRFKDLKIKAWSEYN
jgi:carbamoyl-phosphate synthase large subunit